jgi:hypothetical protein
MKVRELLELLDDTISVELNGGEWKALVFLRLKNMNRVFLELAKSPIKEVPQNPPNV